MKVKLILLVALSLFVLTACEKASEPEHMSLSPDADSNFAAHWLRKDTILIAAHENASQFVLVASNDAKLDEGGNASFSLELSTSTMPEWVASDAPHLASFSVLRVSEISDLKTLLKSQLAVAQLDANGHPLVVSYLQIPSLLDELYTSSPRDADEVDDLGSIINGESTSFAVWAPTAKDVQLLLFDADKRQTDTLSLAEDESGIWRVTAAAPQGTFYRYQVTLYHPRTQQIETLETTDPYSLSLSTNSLYSQVVDLASPETKPDGWDEQQVATLTHPESLILYESHIRDFSASDANLSDPAYAGKYKAFTETQSDGAKHLQSLLEAGLNTVHLLPTYDISTVNEDPSKVIFPQDPLTKLCGLMSQLELCASDIDKSQSLQTLLESFDPLGNEAEALIEQIRPLDPFNWGYDPYHYTVPEGSYAINPEGIPRLIEFREMVLSLHQKGFRVIMDVVYNHTFESGLGEKSVLDKLVPNYYHRLNPITGVVEKSTCCENTATENRMMGKLMLDSLVVWARDYKIDGFRFDLMGHQPKDIMLESRIAVQQVDPDTYFYGEGWNFGEVANNAQFEQAAQIPLAGTEIGTFTDRLRDAVRGGSSFVYAEELRFGQGVGNGLVTFPNDLQTEDKQDAIMAEYFLSMDQLRVGLAGNLSEFPLENAQGERVTGKDIAYGDAPTGYALDPADTINYVSKHDNQTLWDNNSYRFPFEATVAQRVRFHNLALSYPLFAQGIPFLHMGGELLRSKSFLRDSYDYGDWFNKVDFAKQTNNYNVGLPPAVKDEANWDIISKLINQNKGRDMVSTEDIAFASDVFKDFIAIRSGSALFSLQSAGEVIERIQFHNTGPDQQIGLIVMSIKDGIGDNDLDANVDEIMVLFNSHKEDISFGFEGAGAFSLHSRQANGSDEVVKQANASGDMFSIPALTAAVFVK